MPINDFPDISKLTIAEKILLVEDLWDSIATDAEAIPVIDSHIREMERREADRGELLTLEELQRQLAQPE
ncbi:MAG: addiction module protein [Candidatus Xenobia bacterium]